MTSVEVETPTTQGPPETPDIAVKSETKPEISNESTPAKPSSVDTSISKDKLLNVLLIILVIILIYFAVKRYRKQRAGYNKGNESERDDPGADINIQEIIKTIKQKQEQIMKSL